MAGASLLTLLDDIATILDDVALMTKVAAKKMRRHCRRRVPIDQSGRAKDGRRAG